MERRLSCASDEPPVVPDLPARSLRSLDLTSPGESTPERDLVGVLQIPAYRQSTRQSRDPHRHILQLLGNKQRRRLTGRSRIGRDHDLLRSLLADPLDELRYPQILRLDTVQRRERSTEHMIQAPILPRTLYRTDVVRVLHGTDDRGIAPGIGTDVALLGLGQVEAALTRTDPL